MLLLTMSQCIAHYVMYSCVCSFLLGTTFRPKLPSRLTAAKARAAGFYVLMESTPDALPNSFSSQGYHAVIFLIIHSLHLPKYAQSLENITAISYSINGYIISMKVRS